MTVLASSIEEAPCARSALSRAAIDGLAKSRVPLHLLATPSLTALPHPSFGRSQRSPSPLLSTVSSTSSCSSCTQGVPCPFEWRDGLGSSAALLFIASTCVAASSCPSLGSRFFTCNCHGLCRLRPLPLRQSSLRRWSCRLLNVRESELTWAKAACTCGSGSVLVMRSTRQGWHLACDVNP